MMELQELLAPEAVALDISAGSQKLVLEKAAGLLAQSTKADAREILTALSSREREGSTGFGSGTAIPHGRVPGLARIHGAILLLSQPVEWMSVDKLPVDLVVALVGPEEAGPDHLKALALVSRTLRDRPFVEKLRGARDHASLWALLVTAQRRAA